MARSSYLATAGEAVTPAVLSIDWILAQFAVKYPTAQKRYRTFVADGLEHPNPWDRLEGQIYLGGEAFVKKHQTNRKIKEVPGVQTQAHRAKLKALFGNKGNNDPVILQAYCCYGDQMSEIAAHLNLHYSTVSRRLKRAEKSIHDCKT